MRKFHVHSGKSGAALAVRVTPRARRDEISGVREDGTLKIRLTAPPVEGKANAALVAFLAQALGVDAARIEIVAGESGRDKLVSILDLTSEELQAKLDKLLTTD